MAVAGVAGAICVFGCRAPGPGPESLVSPDPDQRIRAIVRTAETKNANAVPLLVDRLEDEDEAVRMFAIEAIRRLTGKSMGWRYYEPPTRRAHAVAAWREWLAGPAGGGASRPAEPRAGEL